MKRIFLRVAFVVTFLTIAQYSKAQVAYSLSDNNQMYVVTHADDPQSTTGPYSIFGITNGQVLVAVTTLPTDGSVYALGYDYSSGLEQLYYINVANSNYKAIAIGQPATGLSLTQGNNGVNAFSFISSGSSRIKLTDTHNNSYIIDANSGTLTDIGNDITSANNLSVGGTSSDNGLLIYPNPTTTTARIVLQEPATQDVYVDIVNMNGSIVRSYRYAPGNYQLDMDMSMLPVGLYSARVSQNGVSLGNLKVIKN